MDINIVKTNNELVEPTQQVLNRTTVPNDNPNAGRGASTSTSDGSGRGNTSGRTVNPQDSDVVKSTTERVPVDFPGENPNTTTTESTDTIETVDDVSQGRGGRTEGVPVGDYDTFNDEESVNNAIESLWASLLGLRFGTNGNLTNIGQQILGFIQSLSNSIKSGGLGLDNNQRVNLASQIYNIASGYMQMQLQQYYARENWLFENEYNSPINQISRLVEAGINPAFYYSASSKDTAGEIGGVDPSQAQLQGVDGMNESQRMQQKIGTALSMLGTIGNVSADMGNLTNLVSQARLASIQGEDIQSTAVGRNTQTFANAAYLTSLKQSNDATLPTNLEEMRTRSLLNSAMIENYAITQNQRWKEIEQAMQICDKQINSSQTIANLQSETSKYNTMFSSKMALQGTKYSADRNFESSKYATDEQVKNSRWCKNMDRRMGLELKAMDNMYDDVFFTQYIDETTGQRTHDIASLGIGVTDAADVKFGTDGTATVGGHRIRRDEVKSHVFNYNRMQYANQTILNLVRYNDENYVPSSTMFHYAKEFDNVFNKAFYNWALPKVSAAYGSYLSDQFLNVNAMGNPEGKGQWAYGQEVGGLTTPQQVNFK